jgi:hypothetical protein
MNLTFQVTRRFNDFVWVRQRLRQGCVGKIWCLLEDLNLGCRVESSEQRLRGSYIMIPKPYTLNPASQSRFANLKPLHKPPPKPQVPHAEPQTPNPEPQTLNPKPQTPDPEP